VEIDPEEFTHRYAELSDEGLLSIDRTDLIELARIYYDAQVASRDLHPTEPATPVEAGPEEDLVLAANRHGKIYLLRRPFAHYYYHLVRIKMTTAFFPLRRNVNLGGLLASTRATVAF
jgi:hypothetical protein